MAVTNAVRIKRADGTWQDIAVQGATGPQGPPGPPGAANSAYTGIWRWTTKTADAASSGDIGINAATWAAVTQVNVSETTRGGSDVSNAFAKLKVGDGFYLQDQSDSTKWARYTISALGTDQGTWRSWPVTLVASGGSPPANNADTNLSLLTQGAQVEEWLSGAGAPAAGLGRVGDWYLNTTTGAVSEKTADTVWTQRANITGPQGAAGATGSQGPQGTPGSIWRSGAGAPAGALGIVGDWYEDTTTGDIYEKTGASTYTLRDNLTGPQGPQGAPGAPATELYIGSEVAAEQGIGSSTFVALQTAAGADLSLTIPSLAVAQTWLIYGQLLLRANSGNDTPVAVSIQANGVTIAEARKGRLYYTTANLAYYETVVISPTRFNAAANTAYVLKIGARMMHTFGFNIFRDPLFSNFGARRIA